MLKYTPGPWRVREEIGDGKCCHTDKCITWTIDGFDRNNIAWIQAWKYADDPDVFDEVCANTKLIAAAPDLLEALTNLLDWAENQCGLSGNDECYGAFGSEEIVAASRLLERLKGETHDC